MCTPGGLRAQPDREDLRLFVENAASLNGTTVAELLQAKMVCACVCACIPSVVTCGHARCWYKCMCATMQSCIILPNVMVHCTICIMNSSGVRSAQVSASCLRSGVLTESTQQVLVLSS